MLHQGECGMFITPPEFPLLRVLLRNLLVHGMTSLFIVHVTPFIHSWITLSFEAQTQKRLLHSVLKTQGYHPQTFQDLS